MKSTIFSKTVFLLTLSFILVTFLNSVTFSNDLIRNQVNNFVDENGDGYSDFAPDHDNDGIPNGKDPDFTRGKGKGKQWRNNFIDENGDGYNDNLPDHDNDGIPDSIDKDYRRRGRSNGKGYKEHEEHNER